jgi:hypothetical protein
MKVLIDSLEDDRQFVLAVQIGLVQVASGGVLEHDEELHAGNASSPESIKKETCRATGPFETKL